ncbi:cell division ATP-binding protein FtsE [Herbiconiux sp. CPCC 203407]|uniref:Cell division ATP-binding protein FtsE n=1 Tax=Herbiconiux oxytropis TaxID=2970915 RepID=A0AA42BVA2_9MICO|nr:cell division ATP-binding protein FtsE [Herbiconiux oxytropis]MCS5721332.1 cell division ATP-binding protein FtsE [Herbiconiux oxytropis]MCS5726229.1 cell division ATP-binding protein FtsE [Herbiconiux oxytropis]
MIRFDHVTKTYRGTKRPALNAVDLEILRGEFVFLVGASGSGKSSFLRLILKEDRPTNGNIHVLGQDLNAISNRKVPYFRRNLGVVFQDFRLLPGKNVFDNVAFTLQVIGKSRGFIQEAVPDVLQMVGLAEKANRLPHELSGGEQQRVAIARAVVNKPAILLADEPTGNLDPSTSAGIMTVLERINAGGTTVVMATHDNAIVDHMKRRVIELVSGQIVRDEDRGGYGMTAEIALQDSGLTAEIALGEGLVRPVGPAQPHVQPAAAQAVQSQTAQAAQAQAAQSQPVQTLEQHAPVQYSYPPQATGPQTPVVEEVVERAPEQTAQAAPAQTAPVQPEPHDPATESLTLAEKLGLRAPGAAADPAKDQNVGPTT